MLVDRAAEFLDNVVGGLEIALRTSWVGSAPKRPESAMKPARSANSTVTWRRSPSPGGAVAGSASGAPSSAIAASSRLRSPSAVMPRSRRSGSVSSDRTLAPMRFSAKAGVYSPRP
jgi:hypothetical protein